MLEIIPLILGPVSTNCYLVADTDSGDTAVIDPAWNGERILAESLSHGWKIGQLWYTHAHFDHYAGAAELAHLLTPAPSVAFHQADCALWEGGGLGMDLGYDIFCFPEPTVDLSITPTLQIGAFAFQVRHAPGHTPGSCMFFCPKEGILFSGDLIFHHSVGRTDLAGGDWDALMMSIRTQVFTLPHETRILPGHGEQTSVGEEMRGNPFTRSGG